MENNLEKALIAAGYTIAEDVNMKLISIKSDFPYRIVEKAGKFILSQGFQARTCMAMTFYRVKVFNTYNEALERIIDRHNKGAKIPGLGRNRIEPVSVTLNCYSKHDSESEPVYADTKLIDFKSRRLTRCSRTTFQP